MQVMKRMAVTGSAGFLAWHLRCSHLAQFNVDMVLIDRAELSDDSALDAALNGVDVVFHLAGVNRDLPDDELRAANLEVTDALARALERSPRPISVVFANSIHSVENQSAFATSKRECAERLSKACAQTRAQLVDVILPNVFGEHGRPFYNSFVATFCYQVFKQETPTVANDRALPLMHAQTAADLLLTLGKNPHSQVVRPEVPERRISSTLDLIQRIADDYRTGQLPNLSDEFTRDIFNTYRSFAFPEAFPIYPDAMTDPRGRLVEAVRARGGEAQVFFSSTRPGMTRGEHFHLRKNERFLVLQGTSEIRMRRLFTDQVSSFRVDGDQSAILDMPTMWAHSITNVSDRDLITLFWADQVFNPLNPDTFRERV